MRSEDEGPRAMAMTAAQDRWRRETAGRPNQGSEVSFCDWVRSGGEDARHEDNHQRTEGQIQIQRTAASGGGW